MRTHSKILLDRLIGLPLVIVFNALCRLLGKLLGRDHSMAPERTRTIVVAKFVGMGSIVQATPLLRALKKSYPRSRLVFLTAERNRELVSRLPGIDLVLTVDDRGLVRLARSTFHAIRRLIALEVDLYFDLEVYSAFAALVAMWSMARNRFGFYRYSTRFKQGIYTHLIYFNARRPVRGIYLQLGLAAGAAAEGDELSAIRVDPADRASLDAKLGAGRLGAPYVAINPNASDLLLERRWPMESFQALIEQLAGKGLTVALTGARDEAAYVAALVGRLSAAARSRTVDSSGRLAMGELLALIEGAGCVVTNDTGPMHFAVALSRPTVALFGPCSPEHYGFDRPWLATHYVPVFCSPCVHEVERPPCAGNNVCMKLIDPEAVAQSVLRLLGGPRAAALPPGPELPVRDDRGRPLGLIVRASL